MTEQTLEKAIEIRKKLKEERDYKTELEEIIECTGKEIHNAEFKLTASIRQTTFTRCMFISHTAAETVLNREIENTMKRIASLEAELYELH